MNPNLRRAVFLDRDGVLNSVNVVDGLPVAPLTLAELRIAPGAVEALVRLRAAGFVLVGVTNQPFVARGIQPREVVEEINAALVSSLPLDDLLVCYHDDRDKCDCRKPAPGLLTRAAAQYAIDLPSSYMVGDRWRDIEAGRRAGCKTVFIDYGYRDTWPCGPPDHTAHSLAEATAWILREP